MNKTLEKLVAGSEVIFWDFDGVIKDSVEVKILAFQKLFSDQSQVVLNQIRDHNERNSGLSRFEKIPLYLSWSNKPNTNKMARGLCDQFSLIVKQLVVESAWVEGFLPFINRYQNLKKHVLVTATPEEEAIILLQLLDIDTFFYEVYGSPIDKGSVISSVLENLKVAPDSAIMLGDSYSDYRAARDNNVLFLLRKTSLNKELQTKCKHFTFEDFNNE
jgi:phosphoglycolate phosphatase-like HAD superfamily hydrolase